jgi:hypothetical protein
MSRIGLSATIVAVSLYGCGFTPGTPSGETSGAGGSPSTGFGGGVGSGNGGAGASMGGSFGTGSSSGAGGDVSPTGTGGGCGQSSVPIMAIPPDILIVQDKSGSMANNDSDQSCKNGCGANSKWSQVTSALNTVVANTQSSIHWGLKFFSDDGECSAGGAPVVGVGTMNAQAVANAISGAKPAGNTPTRDAITTGASYLMGVQDSNPRYLLLATDGLPNCPVGCAGMTNPTSACTMFDNPNEDMAAEAAVLAAAQQGFKTFVIGIGTVTAAVNTLNQLAVNGGEAQTGGATSYYAATDPTALQNALDAIVGAVASCTISLAGAPSGFTNVAVSADTASGPVEIQPDPTNGWSYDANKQNIILNGTSCMDLKSGLYSNLQFYYACDGTTIHIGAVLP